MQAESDESSCRLAVYGTLAPGRKNHWVLESLDGTWAKGVVRGHLHAEGWGATDGYPAMTYDERGPEIEVQVFQSKDLPQHWARIDEFEGHEYRRIVVPVLMKPTLVVSDCNVYELNPNR